MNIGLLFMLIGMGLSIVKSNNWFDVPFFCLSFCWVVGFYYIFIYSFSKTMAKIIIKDIENSSNDLEDPKEIKKKKKTISMIKSIFKVN